MTVSDSGRKVIFRPGGVRVSSAGIRGIVPSPPPVRTPGGGQGGGHGIGQGPGGGRGHGRGGGNSLAALALALGAASATGGKVVPSPPDVGAVTLICSQVLAVSTQTSFDTLAILGGNIPSGYSHLIGYFEGRTTNDFGSVSVGCTMLINHDSGANYYRQGFTVHDTSFNGQVAPGESYVFLGNIPGSAAPAGMAGSVDFLIQRYQSPFYKRARVRNAYQTGTSGTSYNFEAEWVSAWLNTAAVTRLEIIFATVPLLAGGSFYLYGIT